MKSIYTMLLALVLWTPLIAQTESYTVEGKTYDLKTEVDGTLTLLWNVIDKDYRYFAIKTVRSQNSLIHKLKMNIKKNINKRCSNLQQMLISQ